MLLMQQHLLLVLRLRVRLGLSVRLRLSVGLSLRLGVRMCLRMCLRLRLRLLILLLLLQIRLCAVLLSLSLRQHLLMLRGRHRDARCRTSARVRVRHAGRERPHHLPVRPRCDALHLSVRLRHLPRRSRMDPGRAHRLLMRRRHRLRVHDVRRWRDGRVRVRRSSGSVEVLLVLVHAGGRSSLRARLARLPKAMLLLLQQDLLRGGMLLLDLLLLLHLRLRLRLGRRHAIRLRSSLLLESRLLDGRRLLRTDIWRLPRRILALLLLLSHRF
jgi:hypothetical protein